MSDEPLPPADDPGLLAAEYALGLLTGDELARAEALARSDPAFRAEAGRWTGRLGALLDEAKEAAPPADLWDRVSLRLEAGAAPAPSNLVLLKRRVTLWRAYGAVATALAASLALVLVTRAPPPPPAPVAAPARAPMVATLAAEGSAAKLVATWSPDSRNLVIAAAAAAPTPAGKGHELWMIPEGGTPKPMGMMPQAGPMRMVLAVPVAAQLREGVTLAVSVEPAGGSPTGLPTGPVIAAGKLVQT